MLSGPGHQAGAFLRLAARKRALAAASAAFGALGSPGGTLKGTGSRCAALAYLPHTLARAALNTAALGGDVRIQAALAHRLDPLHPQRLRAALPRSPCQCLDRAQKDLCLGLFRSLVGAFRLCPAALALRRPFSVSPAPRLAGSFSPRPTDRRGSPLSLATAVFPTLSALALAGGPVGNRRRLFRVASVPNLGPDILTDRLFGLTFFEWHC